MDRLTYIVMMNMAVHSKAAWSACKGRASYRYVRTYISVVIMYSFLTCLLPIEYLHASTVVLDTAPVTYKDVQMYISEV